MTPPQPSWLVEVTRQWGQTTSKRDTKWCQGNLTGSPLSKLVALGIRQIRVPERVPLPWGENRAVAYQVPSISALLCSATVVVMAVLAVLAVFNYFFQLLMIWCYQPSAKKGHQHFQIGGLPLQTFCEGFRLLHPGVSVSSHGHV